MVVVACFLPGRAKNLSPPLVHNKRHRSRELNPPKAATKAGHGNTHLHRERTESWKKKTFLSKNISVSHNSNSPLFLSLSHGSVCLPSTSPCLCHAYETPPMIIYILKATFYTADRRTGRKCVKWYVRVLRTGQYVKKSSCRAGHLNGNSRTLQNYSTEHNSPPHANNHSASQDIPTNFMKS